METVLLKIPEIVTRLALGQTKVYELMATSELRSGKVGRSRRIPSPELEGFIAELDDSRPNMGLSGEATAAPSPRFQAAFPQSRRPAGKPKPRIVRTGRTRKGTLVPAALRIDEVQ